MDVVAPVLATNISMGTLVQQKAGEISRLGGFVRDRFGNSTPMEQLNSRAYVSKYSRGGQSQASGDEGLPVIVFAGS